MTLRPFNTYGPRQSDRAVIPTVVSQALTQDEIRLGNLEPSQSHLCQRYGGRVPQGRVDARD